MGLCKCPKRQVTNQFCFEHRVNVCENCMITNHPKCIVQSYLQWLRDSDYISNCTLCSTTLENGDCLRLVCYHVFHWDCLNARQSSLPANTAPRGHQCPICNEGIFPPLNLVSPVADTLKNCLSQANWGRNGLGLTLIPEDGGESSEQSSAKHHSISSVTKIHYSGVECSKHSFDGTAAKMSSPHSVLLMDAFNPSSSVNDVHGSSRRSMMPRRSPIGLDRDDNKYKRRTPAEIFSRWTRRFYAPSSRPPWRRTWFLVLSGVAAFLVLIYVMASIGRRDSNDPLDESWDDTNPMPNQNRNHE